MTKRALIVVDVQNDFVEGGALGVNGGIAVAENTAVFIARHSREYTLTVNTLDWHEPLSVSDNGGHFANGEAPDYDETWPVHCVMNSDGSTLRTPLADYMFDATVRKGTGEPAYSGFEGRTDDGQTLTEILRNRGVTDVDVCGIATDYCVKATAMDAIAAGFNVRLIDDLHAPVNAETGKIAMSQMVAVGVETVSAENAF